MMGAGEGNVEYMGTLRCPLQDNHLLGISLILGSDGDYSLHNYLHWGL